jgi:CheY-like chemotaxis protein
MEHGIEDEEERKHAFGAIVSNGHVLLDLVNDVLDLSKLDAGKTVLVPELTDFEQLASDVLHTFDVAVSGKDVDLEEDFTPIPPLMIDRHRIRQILFNLIGNAVKFTERGEIILTAQFEKNPDEDAKTGILTFSISDTGCGIPPDDLEHILEPFVQAKNSGAAKGTGLGLSICQQLTKLMNGTITVKSALGKGTTFTVVLPDIPFSVANTDALPSSNRITPVSQFAVENLRVLLVDDVPVNIRVLQAMLRRLGVTNVVTAGNGAEALEALEKDASFNMVLTDMWMPVLDGEGLIREIRKKEQWKELAVYIVTADVEAQKTYRKSGFSGILLKPITLEKLRGVIG